MVQVMKYVHFADHVMSNGVPEELITLLDLSGSMNEDDWKPSRKAGAIKANIELIKVKAKHHPQDRVGIVGFGTEAQVLHQPVSLTNGTDALLKALRNPASMGYTNFTAALQLAESCLFGHSTHGQNTGANKGVVGFFSELLYGPLQQSSHHITENATVSESGKTTDYANR